MASVLPTSPVVLLVAPPVLYGGRWWSNRLANKPHLHSLAGALRGLAEVEIIELDRVAYADGLPVATGGDGSEADPCDAVITRIDEGVALVGISCWTSMHYVGAADLIRRIRAERPDTRIVVGGHHATAVPGDFVGLADWVVTGDGEGALRALCEGWPARPSETQIVSGQAFAPREVDHIDWDRAIGSEVRDGALWLTLSRGCPFRCRFCMEPLRGTSYGAYDVEQAVALVARLVRRHGPRAVAFADPLFGAKRRWTEAFLDGLAAHALPVTFWAETRADLMTPALLERFARCGFKLDFGLDTGSVTMAGLMEKAPKPASYLERSAAMLREADRVGLHHGVYLLFNYPGETPQTVAETQAFIERLDDTLGPTSGWLSGQTFFMIPGTESFRRQAEYAQRFGTVVRHPTWWRERADHYTLATDVLPSAAWLGREDELAAFTTWQAQINARWSASYSAKVKRFCERYYR